MRFSALAAAALVAFAAMPALAGHCPRDMRAIDAAMSKNPSLSSAQKAEVAKLRAEGEQLHRSGSHAASLEKLEKAMGILGISHR